MLVDHLHIYYHQLIVAMKADVIKKKSGFPVEGKPDLRYYMLLILLLNYKVKHFAFIARSEIQKIHPV